MTAYYNEREPYAAQWLRNLIDAGHIAPGVVDERDIRDVRPDELMGYTQCHFFAGIGVWSHALRRAGWPDDRPIWTGSCPCQPFSAAGARAGFDDERHLWPHWHWLINQCRPPVVVGEQVASKDGLGWLDLVSADMEASGYSFGASDLCAAGFGGAHIRQRLYFAGMADSNSDGRAPRGEIQSLCTEPNNEYGGAIERLADAERDQRGQVGQDIRGSGERSDQERVGQRPGDMRPCGGVVNPDDQGSQGHRKSGDLDVSGGREAAGRHGAEAGMAGNTHAPMLGRNPADWLFCRDGKWRPVGPGTFPLVDETPSRVGRLRAYGNALDAETAEGFISAVMDVVLD